MPMQREFVALHGYKPRRAGARRPYRQNGVGSTIPVLTASADKFSGPAPLTAAFTLVAVDLFAPSYQWDFGDGSIARDAASLHTFAAGTYAVVAHAIFANGAVLSSEPLAVTAAARADLAGTRVIERDGRKGNDWHGDGVKSVSRDTGAPVVLQAAVGRSAIW